MRNCAACGLPIREHEPAIVVRVSVGTDPADGVDYYPDEVAAQASPFVASLFATTRGLSGASIEYGEPCFAKLFAPAAEAVAVCESRRAPERARRPAAARPRARSLGETDARRIAEEQAAYRARRQEEAAAIIAKFRDEITRQHSERRGNVPPGRGPRGDRA